MAIYHLSMKSISRSAGRSAVAAAAYRAAEKISDPRTGEIHDYSRKSGVAKKQLILPGGQQVERADFWGKVETHHKRGDAMLAWEIEVALPDELDRWQRRDLAMDYGRHLAQRYGVAADVCIHRPGKDGDDRNHHAHILLSSCSVASDGTLGKKAVELDPIHCQRAKIENAANEQRREWEQRCNCALEKADQRARIDRRTLQAQGIARVPQPHLGPAATALERKGRGSRVRRRCDEQRAGLRHRAEEVASAEREVASAEREVASAEREVASAEREAARAPAQASAQASAQQKIVRAFQERMLRGFAPTAPAAAPDPDQDDQDAPRG